MGTAAESPNHRITESPVPVGIIGARGFTGGELLRLLVSHPQLQLDYVTSESQAGMPVSESFPTLGSLTDLRFERYDPDTALSRAQAFFFALPDGEAMKAAPALIEAGARVVDLSGDFRLKDPAEYARWYGREHASPHLLAEAVYGMPELNREAITTARLVANPGCYATAGLLALAPLVAGGLTNPRTLIIDAKSGVSGAGGRVGMKEEFSFPAVNESFRAYGAPGHRHTAEMEQSLAGLAPADGERLLLQFTPHLLPITRGILATCYADVSPETTAEDLVARYREFYAAAPFVTILEPGQFPQTGHVTGSNFARIGVAVDSRTRRALVTCAIDNLMKGAAGQALHNLNLMLGLPEDGGLRLPALYP
jgi:N-acetyl-gamma-glutamyl-phosphate reductase